MIRKQMIGLGCAAMLLFCGATASAERFDFGAFGKAPPDGDGEQSADGVPFTEDGITPGITPKLTILPSAFLLAGGSAEAYLDGFSGGLPAGLGVCQDVQGGQCDPSSDDNLTAGEVLKLTFSEQIQLVELLFRNADHMEDFEFGAGEFAQFGIAVDTMPTDVGDFTAFTIAGNPFSLATPLIGTEFYFISDATLNGRSGAEAQLYINAVTTRPVPEPRTTILFGLGLAFLAWWGISNDSRRAQST